MAKFSAGPVQTGRQKRKTAADVPATRRAEKKPHLTSPSTFFSYYPPVLGPGGWKKQIFCLQWFFQQCVPPPPPSAKLCLVYNCVCNIRQGVISTISRGRSRGGVGSREYRGGGDTYYTLPSPPADSSGLPSQNTNIKQTTPITKKSKLLTNGF